MSRLSLNPGRHLGFTAVVTIIVAMTAVSFLEYCYSQMISDFYSLKKYSTQSYWFYLLSISGL